MRMQVPGSGKVGRCSERGMGYKGVDWYERQSIYARAILGRKVAPKGDSPEGGQGKIDDEPGEEKYPTATFQSRQLAPAGHDAWGRGSALATRLGKQTKKTGKRKVSKSGVSKTPMSFGSGWRKPDGV